MRSAWVIRLFASLYSAVTAPGTKAEMERAAACSAFSMRSKISWFEWLFIPCPLDPKHPRAGGNEREAKDASEPLRRNQMRKAHTEQRSRNGADKQWK